MNLTKIYRCQFYCILICFDIFEKDRNEKECFKGGRIKFLNPILTPSFLSKITAPP